MESPSLSVDLNAPITTSLSPFEALFGVILRPYATFVRMREAVVGHWWLALILAVLSLTLYTLATVPIQAEDARAVFEQQQEQFSDMPSDQQAQIEQTQAVFTSAITLGIIGFVTLLVGTVLGYLIRSGLLYLLGIAFGGRATFKQIWRMSVWTTIPDVIRNIVAAIAVFATGQLPAGGLRYIFTSKEAAGMSPVLMEFLKGIDLYTIWSLLLIGVGLHATYQISKGKSTFVTIIYWVIGLIFTLGFAAAGAAMQGAFTGAG